MAGGDPRPLAPTRAPPDPSALWVAVEGEQIYEHAGRCYGRGKVARPLINPIIWIVNPFR